MPRQGKPPGAVRVTYGHEQLTYRKLPRKLRDKPTKKFFEVSLPFSEEAPGILEHKQKPSRSSDIQTKKLLLRLKPYQYFGWSSNPKLDLRARAVLQFLKRPLAYVSMLHDLALKELRMGERSKGAIALYTISHKMGNRLQWSLYDHLLYRYVQWTVRSLGCAKYILKSLVESTEDLAFAYSTTSSKRVPRRGTQWAPDHLFVIDKEYTTVATL
jgi:hypothetical protein